VLVVINAHAEGKAALVREGYAHQLRKVRELHGRERPQLPARPPLDAGTLDIEVVFDEATDAEVYNAAAMQTEQQLKRRANVMTVAAEAADQLGDDASDEPLDPDWVARFFTYAQDVSREELQKLWGKLLAGEVCRPGGVPLRTLEILRNLSVDEAGMIQRLATVVSANGVYLHCAAGMPAHDLRRLEEAGVLVQGEHINFHTDVPKAELRANPFKENRGEARVPYRDGRTLVVNTTHADVTFVPIWRASAASIPLLNANRVRTDPTYLSQLVRELNEAHKNATAKLEGSAPEISG
jgi:hypothetical protein